MGSWVSYWFVVFVLTLILSIACVCGLLACKDIVPESMDWEITRDGRQLARARTLFVAASGVIFICLLLSIHFLDASDNSQLFRWFDEHQRTVPVLPMLMLVSSGLSGVSFLFAQTSKGEGRRVMLVVTAVNAVLSLLVAVFLIGQ